MEGKKYTYIRVLVWIHFWSASLDLPCLDWHHGANSQCLNSPWVLFQDNDDVLSGNNLKGWSIQLRRLEKKLLSFKHALCRHKVLTPVLSFCIIFLNHTNYIIAWLVIADKFKEWWNIEGHFGLVVRFLFSAVQVFCFLTYSNNLSQVWFMRDLQAILALETLLYLLLLQLIPLTK